MAGSGRIETVHPSPSLRTGLASPAPLALTVVRDSLRSRSGVLCKAIQYRPRRQT
jgi:hypothetical protein